MWTRFKRRAALVISTLVASSLVFAAIGWKTEAIQQPGPVANGTVRLHNGWKIHPVGDHSPQNDMPTLMTVSPDGKYVLVGTTGWHTHTLSVFEIGTKSPELNGGPDYRVRTEAISSVTLPNAWRGIAFGRGKHSDELYVSGGPSHLIWRFHFDTRSGRLRELDPLSVPPAANVGVTPVPSGQQKALDPIPIPEVSGSRSFPGGLTVLPDGSLLVVDEAADRGPYHADQLYHVDPFTGTSLGRVSLSKDAGPITSTPDGKKIYAAEHGEGRVLVLNASDLHEQKQIAVGSQPNALLADNTGRIFCANTGSDTVSVIDVASDEVVQTIHTSLTSRSPVGSVPNALAISPDQKTLYVANGGNNDVAVIELGQGASAVRGFIPTGWYPVSVAVSPHNDWLFIGVGKGFRAYANNQLTPGNIGYRVGQLPGQSYGPNHDKSLTHDYIMSGLRGGLTRLAVPTRAQLEGYSKLAIASSPYRDAMLDTPRGVIANSALPAKIGGKSPFEHVLYIIKENRTYDQVLGDLKQGDGDPNLVLYGRNVTPNHHAIAENFVLLDNTYCDGEVSQDGWEWSTAANDSDWDIKATTYSYSGRGDPPGSRETIRPSNGYLWEWAAKRGLTYYSYGAKTFAGLFSPTWKGNFSEEWNETRRTNVPDYLKADLFVHDLKQAEKSGKWPNLVVMSLTDDHTTGTRVGSRTPYASVGSNDLAIGKVLEAVTRSKFWEKTAVFIIEDDAQNGPDHVDSHRTVALVASPYTRRGSVDHTMYTSSSLVRSIELCLGLPPTSQYDASAMPMFSCFTGKKDLRPYVARRAQVDLNAMNSRNAPMARESASMDFSDVDLANWDTLNRILWKSARPQEPYPGSFTSYTGR